MQSVIDIPLKVKFLLGYCLAASISSYNTKEPSLCVSKMASGTKRQMHYWQHKKILKYYNKYGRRPPWNKSFW